jgi:hypothetical protein
MLDDASLQEARDAEADARTRPSPVDGRARPVALITGATGGLGRAFAEALDPGTDLVLTGRNQEALERQANKLARPDRSVATVAADLTVEADRARVVEAAEAAGVSLFINNAGIGKLGAVVEQPAEAEQATVALNVVAMHALTRALLPGMLARARAGGPRAGLIVVSSGFAFMAVPYLATYAASKVFALSFAEALGEELSGEPIDVLALCPGPTSTDFGAEAGPFTPSRIPGAARPGAVAKRALAALGSRRVLATGLVGTLAVQPLMGPRQLVNRSVGRTMRVFDRLGRRR